MKIIGFSAGVIGRDSNTDRMVKDIMEKTGYEWEFVKLTDLNYSACKGCVWLCAKPEVCMLEDDLLPHIQKIKEVDAVVLGTPVHHGAISAIMTAFISRLWGFRHVNFSIKGKLFILAICGIGRRGDRSEEYFRRELRGSKVNIVDVVHYSSTIPPCYQCERHQECFIGAAYKLWGNKAHSLTITPELFNKWEDNPETVAKIEVAVEKLSQLL